MNHGMAFIPQISVTAQKTKGTRTHVRSKALPCFSKIQDETRPFFIQWHISAIDVSRIMSISYENIYCTNMPLYKKWHISAIDVSRIMSISYDDARQKMQQMR